MKRSANDTDDTCGGPSRTEAGRADNKAMRARTAGFRPIAAIPSVVKEDRDSTPLQTSAHTAGDAGPRPEAVI
jgi:hypothetical protein